MKSILCQQQQFVHKESSTLNRNMEMLASLPIKNERKNLTVNSENHYQALIDIYQNKKNQITTTTPREFVENIYKSVTNIEKHNNDNNIIMNNSKTDLKQLISNCVETVGKDKLTTTTTATIITNKLPMANSNNLIEMNTLTKVESTQIVVVDHVSQKENIKTTTTGGGEGAGTTTTTTTTPMNKNSKSLYSMVSKSTTAKNLRKLHKNKDINDEKFKIVASLSSLAQVAATNLNENNNNNNNNNNSNNNTNNNNNKKCEPKITNKIKNGIMSIKNSNRIPSDILDDLASRFVINVPDIELSNLIRICFQIELAHWFYLDFFCTTISKHQTNEQNTRKKIKKKQIEKKHINNNNNNIQKKHLSSTSSNELSDMSIIMDEQTELKEFSKYDLQPCGIKYFALQLFQHIPFLRQHSASVDKILEDWKNYKLSVPTFGAILVSEDLNYCLLVQSYFAKTSWGFPKGKVNENEDPVHCATREVYEETGYDISSIIDPNDYIEAVINYQYTRLYIVRNVSLTTEFVPRTRYEIRCCDWFPIDSLPVNKTDATSTSKLGIKINSFFMIMPFVKRLKRWVSEKRTSTESNSASESSTTTTATIITTHENKLQHSASANEFRDQSSSSTTTNPHNNNNYSDTSINSKIKTVTTSKTFMKDDKKHAAGNLVAAFNNNKNIKYNSKICMTTKEEELSFFKQQNKTGSNQSNKIKGGIKDKQKFGIQASKSAAKMSFGLRNRTRHKSMGDLDDAETKTKVTETVIQRINLSTPPITENNECTPQVHAFRKLFQSESIQETKRSSTKTPQNSSVQNINSFNQQNLTNTPITSNLYTNDYRRKNFSTNKLFKKIIANSQGDENHIVYFSDNKIHEPVNKQETPTKDNTALINDESELSGCLKIASSLINTPVKTYTPNVTPKLNKSNSSGSDLLTIASLAANNAIGSTKRFIWKPKSQPQTATEHKSDKMNLSNLSITKNVFNDWDLDGILFNSSTDNSSESSSSSTYSGTSSTGSAATDSPLHSLSPSPTALIPHIQSEGKFESIKAADRDLGNPKLFMSPITTAAELEAQVLNAAKKFHHMEKDAKLDNTHAVSDDKCQQIDQITINAWRNFTFTETIVSNVFY